MQSRSSALRLTGVSLGAALIAVFFVAQGRALDSTYRLVLQMRGGTVTALGGGVHVRCTVTCSKLVRSNAVVKLIAFPKPGYVFSRWSGSCVGTAPRCLLIMSSSKLVRAVFITATGTTTTTTTTQRTAASRAQFAEVNVTVSGPGIVKGGWRQRISCVGGGPTVSGCHGLFKLGKKLILRAHPNQGHQFAQWGFDAQPCGKRMKCKVQVTRSAFYIAAFGP